VLARTLPPVVRILSPADGATIVRSALEVIASLRSPSGDPISSVGVSIDGRPAPFKAEPGSSAGLRVIVEVESNLYHLAVEIPPRNCVLEVTGATEHSISEPAVIHLKWAGPMAARPKPRLFVLAVGVSSYANRDYALQFAAKDARDLTAAFRPQEGRFYSSLALRVLVDGQATRGALLDGLHWLERDTGSDDVVLVFLAGHGLNDPKTGEYSFLPYDGDVDRKHTVVVSDHELRQRLASIKGRIVLLLDTCHAGNVLQGQNARDLADVARFVNELTAAGSGVVVFSAADKNQVSRESPSWRNGAFTSAMLEGLGGSADLDHDGQISITELEHYVSKRVNELTAGEQTPVVAKPAAVQDFALAAAPAAAR
jgi:hypothetical protein